jgi:hypothetical protein
MTGCLTCGGYGNRHDPIAHDAEREAAVTEPICPDCQSHEDGSFTCDPSRERCPYEPDPFPIGTRVDVYEMPGGYLVARARDQHRMTAPVRDPNAEPPQADNAGGRGEA